MDTISGKPYFKDGFEVYVHACEEFSPRTGMHAHDFTEIAYVAKGNGTHHVGTKNKYEVLVGDMFVINSYESHYYTNTNNLEIYYILIGPHMLKRNLKVLRDIPGFCEFFYVEPIFREETEFSQHLHVEREFACEIENTLEKMKAELESRNCGYKIMVESLLLQFFLTISRLYYGFSQKSLKPGEIDSKKKAVDEVIAYIEHHYKEDIKLSDLARCGCLQSEYLCRVFRKLTGLTMIEYITGIRIRRASQMLIHTTDSITDICYEVGFNDLSYFIRTFHKTVGMSPSEFRKKSK